MPTPSNIRRCQDYVQAFQDDLQADEPTLENPTAMLAELLWLLDELEQAHAFLDQRDIPRTDPLDGMEMGLTQRVAQLVSAKRLAETRYAVGQMRLLEGAKAYQAKTPISGQIAVFRARFQDDGREWDAIPIYGETRVVNDLEANFHAYRLAADLIALGYAVAEIRWNFKGSLQGHYLPCVVAKGASDGTA